MKPLILTFFAIILCYSLFTRQNNETKPKPVFMNERSPFFDKTNHHEIKQPQSADSTLFTNYLTVLE
jgi:hypothetical protein